MGVLDIFRGPRREATTPTASKAGDVEVFEAGTMDSKDLQIERLTEAAFRLANFAEDRGWDAIQTTFQSEISRGGLGRNADLVRAFSTMNPLMKRGKIIRTAYVFGEGVTISALDQGEKGHQDVESVVAAYLEDEGNREAVFGAQALSALEGDFFDDGNYFVGHWVDPLTGRVQVRTLPFDEITDVVTKPGDRSTPWYYKREWVEALPTGNGYEDVLKKTAYYPALKYQPRTQQKYLNGHPVMWPGQVVNGYGSGAAVYHSKVNPIGRSRIWGIGDGYAAMPWARSYKEFLEDWASYMKAISRIAWHFKDKKGSTAHARTAAQVAGGDAGGITYGSMEVESPNSSGASLDAGSGRPLASMVAAALGVTVTILTADPGQEGARAVAQTLDRPQRLEMMARREVHAEFFRASTAYAIEQAVKAPRGALKGRIEQDGDRQLVVFTDQTDPTVEVTFPTLEDINQKELIESIAGADATGKVPPVEIMKLLLRALGFEDVAEIVEEYTDDEGNWIDPNRRSGDAAGQAAADAARRGEDPSGIL